MNSNNTRNLFKAKTSYMEFFQRTFMTSKHEKKKKKKFFIVRKTKKQMKLNTRSSNIYMYKWRENRRICWSTSIIYRRTKKNNRTKNLTKLSFKNKEREKIEKLFLPCIPPDISALCIESISCKCFAALKTKGIFLKKKNRKNKNISITSSNFFSHIRISQHIIRPSKHRKSTTYIW